MISYNCYSNTYANDRLIRLNKFVSVSYVISFFISIRIFFLTSHKIFNMTYKNFSTKALFRHIFLELSYCAILFVFNN